MDTLTHALSGALAARATEPSAARADQLPPRVRLWVGFWAAAFPDSDFIARFIDPLTYLATHRGITHSVVMLPFWAVVLAAAFVWIYRRRYSWRAFVGVCAIGVGAHILGDVITAFGTMVFAPLSSWRAAWPTTFIIDLYFTAIIVAGLVAAAFSRMPRRAALVALVALAGYVGFQGLMREQALAAGRAYAARAGLDGAAVEALPQPFSPFHWMIVVSDPARYQLAYVSLVRNEPAAAPSVDASWLRHVYASYRPLAHAQWQTVARYGEEPMDAALAKEVWHSGLIAAYRGFAQFPALYRVDHNRQTTCVWFHDLRFLLAGRDMPFRYGACRAEGAAPWRLHRLIKDGTGREVADALPTR